jgi:hypothetical protein
MALSVRMITIDCIDPIGLAEFWSAALGLAVETVHGNYVYLARPDDGGPVVSLQGVPEPRIGKNRVHLDLDGSREIEVPRLVALGARVLAEHEAPNTAWTVMADPEGNEFCVGEDAE